MVDEGRLILLRTENTPHTPSFASYFDRNEVSATLRRRPHYVYEGSIKNYGTEADLITWQRINLEI